MVASAYHQIGLLYAKKQSWEAAVLYLQQAAMVPTTRTPSPLPTCFPCSNSRWRFAADSEGRHALQGAVGRDTSLACGGV